MPQIPNGRPEVSRAATVMSESGPCRRRQQLVALMINDATDLRLGGIPGWAPAKGSG